MRSDTNIIRGAEAAWQCLWRTHCPRQACRIVEWRPSTSPAGGAEWEESFVTQQVPSTEPERPECATSATWADCRPSTAAGTPRVLFRSGHLAHATAEDTAFLSSLGLHTVFDFRNAARPEAGGPTVALPACAM
ncbi:hypothetical protein GCM10023238_30550 [Streptomyces heliomycini]